MLVIIILGFGLAMDAFAASITSGVCSPKKNTQLAVKTAAFYGVFQGMMPIIGYFLGVGLLHYIEKFDHWVVFILLSIIGVKMISDALREDSCDIKTDYGSTKILLVMAFVTSIDALAVGITLAVSVTNIALAALTIGIITFIMCFLGVVIGSSLGEKFKRGSLVFGGLILIIIGIKILTEHIFFM